MKKALADLLPGDRVRKLRDHPGVYDVVIGRGVVARVTKLFVILDDGSRWNRRTGYEQGAQRTRGVGLSFEPRIEHEATNA